MKKIFFCCSLVFGLLVINSCKKPPTTVVTPTPAGLGSNVHFVDSLHWTLVSQAAEVAVGEYFYKFTPNTPYIDVKIGDIIVGTAGEGYIRKISRITLTGSTLNLQTSQAGLADVFKGGNFSFDVDLSGINNSPAGFYDSFSNVILYNASGNIEKITSGTISMNPTWHISLGFDSTHVTGFSATTTSAAFSTSHTLNLTTISNVYFGNKTSQIGDFSKSVVKMVTVGTAQVPVVVTLEVSVSATANGSAYGNGYNGQETFSSSGTFDMGVQYANGAWSTTYSLNPASSLTVPPVVPVPFSAHGDVTISPKVNIKLYGVSCVYSTLANTGSLSIYNNSSALWDFNAFGRFSVNTGAMSTIFGSPVPNYTNALLDTASTFSYSTPYSAVIDSGDAQNALVQNPLPDKLVVKVVDSYGNPQKGVSVAFVPATSCGSVSPSIAITDDNGLAKATWTLGTIHGSQSVTVNVKHYGGAPVNGSPTAFSATGL